MTVDVQNICVGFVVRGQRKLTYEFRYISGLCGGEIAFRERAQETRAFHFFNFLRGVAVVNPGVVGVACRVEGRRKIVEFEPALTEQSFCAVLFRFLAAEIIGDDMFPAADGSIHPVGREIPVEIRQIQSRQQHSCQDSDDRNYHEEFYKGEHRKPSLRAF